MITQEINENRKKIREIDKQLEDFQNYFEKVEHKLNKRSFKKMFKRITWFVLGILVGTIFGWKFFQIVFDYAKGLIG